jgi:dTDP-4-dehydrorhamnose 3,5-epimerase
MEIRTTAVAGCVEMQLTAHGDQRGVLVKVFQDSVYRSLGVPFEVREVFFSRSRRGVVRGLHFQVPPAAGAKLVFCLDGSITDVIVDLRVGSPTFAEHVTLEIAEHAANAVLVPTGCAHGFVATSDDALVGYVTDHEYDPAWDTGIHWASAGIEWGVDSPIVSERDDSMVPLAAFESPFVYMTTGT